MRIGLFLVLFGAAVLIRGALAWSSGGKRERSDEFVQEHENQWVRLVPLGAALVLAGGLVVIVAAVL